MKLKGGGGTIKTNRKAYVKGYDEAGFDEQAIVVIFALENAKSKFRVNYDMNNYGVFTVHNPIGGYMHFNIHKEQLHFRDTSKSHVLWFKTVIHNKSGHSKRQLKSSKLARELYSKIGPPYHNYFKNLIKFNKISNFLVTLKDTIREK